MKINLTNRNTVGTVKLTTGSAPLAGATGSQGSQGVQGSQGAQGFQGVQGAQGLPGTAVAKGDKGDTGVQGFQGIQGAQGVQGSQGTPGTSVAKGDKGDTGAQGIQGGAGTSGSKGEQGVQGATGATGPQGLQGVQGAAGSKGELGNQGVQGAVGAQGDQGAAGSKGDKGEVGAQGLAGSTGAQGVQGTAGVDGAQGAIGAQGIQGAQGTKGDKGDDVNSIAAFNQANAAYLQANSAYDDANTRVLKAGDTMTGNLNVAATIISQNIVPALDITYDLGTPEKRFRDLYLSGTTLFLGNTQVSTTVDDEIAISSLTANAINLAGYNVQTWITDTTERANLKVQTIEGELLTVSTSNTSNVVVANITIRQGNTTHTGVVQLSDNVNNTSITLAATANTVNVAYEQAKLARTEVFDLTALFSDLNTFVLNALVPTVNIAANTVRVSANGGSTLSKQQLNFTNTADVIVSVGAGAGAASGNANIEFTLGTTGAIPGTYGDSITIPSITVDAKGRITNISNVSISSSSAAYDQANAAYEAANTKLPIAGGTITGDLVVSGNLSVLGDSTVLNVETLLVEDNEIVLNSNVTGEASLNALITVNRGANSNVALRWNETDDKWEWTDDGSTYTSFASLAEGNAQAGLAYDTANTALGVAQNAYNAANGAASDAYSALVAADLAHDDANTALNQAASAYNQANAAYDAANTANTTPIQVDASLIGTRRTIDFQSANTSNLTITGTDDAGNNKVILIFDNPKLGGSGVSAYGNTELYISDTPPGSANSNTALWWRANTGKFYIYFNDGTSEQWVSLTPSPIVDTSANLFSTEANTAASIAAANTLYQEKADRAGDTFTGNVSILQSGAQLNLTSAKIESNSDLTVKATQYKVNNITISANTSATSVTAQTVVDMLPASEYRTIKYLIQIKSNSNYQATEILLLHDGTTTYMTEYGTVTTGSYLGSFGSDINSGQIRLLFDPVFGVNTLNISRISAPV